MKKIKKKMHKELEALYRSRLKELTNVKVRIFPSPSYREKEHKLYFVVEFINTITNDIVAYFLDFETAVKLVK